MKLWTPQRNRKAQDRDTARERDRLGKHITLGEHGTLIEHDTFRGHDASRENVTLREHDTLRAIGAICTVSLLSMCFTPSAYSVDLVLSAGLQPSYGMLLLKSQEKVSPATISRLAAASSSISAQSEESRIRWQAQFVGGYDLELGTVDYRGYSVGVEFLLYHPEASLWQGRVVKSQNLALKPFLKCHLAEVVHTTILVNTSTEAPETNKIDSLGGFFGAGADYQLWFGELGVVIAPVALSQPAYTQFWTSFTLGYRFQLHF